MSSLESCKALIALDDAKALAPHGIGGLGRACLGWAVAEIERQRAALAEINRIAHVPTPQGTRAYTHLMRDFDKIRALTAVEGRIRGEGGTRILTGEEARRHIERTKQSLEVIRRRQADRAEGDLTKMEAGK